MRTEEQRRKNKKRKRRSSFASWVIICLGLSGISMAGLAAHLSIRLNDAEDRLKQLQESQMPEETDAGSSAKSGSDTDSTSESYSAVNSYNVVAVGKPKQRTRTEAIEELKALGKNDSAINDICKNSTQYPDQLLEALANNPEMADFVAGWSDTHGDEKASLTKAELAEEFPLFLQWDSRWGYHSYGTESVIGLSGCGPTCLSMMLYYLTGKADLTPDVIADYSMEQGYYVEGSGTSWSLMTDIADRYEVQVSQLSLSESSMKSVLDDGGIIICALRPGDFTSMGHFILIYDYGEDGFYVNDPNCVARSRQHWSYEKLAGQIKNLWGYTR